MAAVEEVAGRESVEVVEVCRVSAQIVSRVETGASDADCGFLLQLAMAHTIAMMRMRGFMIIVVIFNVKKEKQLAFVGSLLLLRCVQDSNQRPPA